MSANGMIADKNGSEGFLSDENWDTFSELVEVHGNLIAGRKAYEVVSSWSEEYSFDDFDATKVILSRSENFNPPEGYTKSASPEEALATLKENGFKTALVCGGATVNTAFAREGLIDEVILNIESVCVGEGIPLFAPDDFTMNMELIETKQISDTIVQLHYSVK